MAEKLFNDGWSFMLKNVGSELTDAVSEECWHDVEIPHDWLIGDTSDLYRSNDGWYRKSFFIEDLSDNDVYILRFDGIYMNSTVYVNGEEAGYNRYGYSSFSIDITGYIRKGSNDIYVRVRYESPNTRWYSGAGIFRNVYLRRTNKLHIKENGIYISSRKYDGDNKWIVIIETESSGDFTVRHRVLDRLGRKCAEVSAEQKDGFSRSAFYAVNPVMWDINTPVVYEMISDVVSSDGEILDSVSNIFGFRTIEFDPDRGFILNDRKVKLHGVCMHHDLGALGAAFNEAALRRQLKILKSFGVNAIRTSHNMPARELISMCCEMGFLVDDESFDMWELPKNENDYSRFFADNYEKDVKSWITRDRNAPCVIMWSIGNEIYDTHVSPHGLETAKKICSAVHKYDRYGNAACTIASNYMKWENAQNVADQLKLAGYNYAEDLYWGHHEAFPDWFIYGSETASTVRSRGIYHFPSDTSVLIHEDLQCSDYGNSVVGWGKSSEQSLIDDRDCRFCGGQFVWTGFDYIGEPTPYDTKNSYFGIVDTAGFPKDSYYLYKALWCGKDTEPFVHLAPYWDFNIGEEITVRAYTNMNEIELRYNGRSLGRQHIDLENGDKLYGEWTLRYRKGSLTATAYDDKGNEAAKDMICSFGDPESIDAVPDKYIMHADGRDLIFIEISVSDKSGITVENARNRIKVVVDGAARLVGLDNGDSTDYDSYKGDNRRLFSGKLLAIIESTLEPGEITVSIRSEGLWGKELVFTSLECEKPEGISVVDEYYPKKTEDYFPEIPLRKIELYSTRSILEPESAAAGITARLFPENTTYTDIEFKSFLPSGTPIDIAEIERTEYGAKITGRGDGAYIIRASSKNGTDIPSVYSEIHMVNSGFGSIDLDPYQKITAAKASYVSRPLRNLANETVKTDNERIVISFNNIGFGSSGSDRIIIHAGYNEEREPMPIELWLDDPDKPDSRLITILPFEFNNQWSDVGTQEFLLPERLRDTQNVSFVFKKTAIFGGFEFIGSNRAYDKIKAADNDEIYGDVFNVSDGKVIGIGNNVTIKFNGLDFNNGVHRVTICGKTPENVNTIQIRSSAEDGTERTALVEFRNSSDYEEQSFDIDGIDGVNDVSFIFLPGSRFDLDWFRFE